MAIRDNKGLSEQADAISDYVDVLLTGIWHPDSAAEERAIPGEMDTDAPTGGGVPTAREPETVVEAEAEPPRPPVNGTEEIKVMEESDATRLENSAGVVPVIPQGSRAPESKPQVSTGPALPAWAEETFQALMFEINGIPLGVPLISLVSILKWDGDACAMPGQPDWQLGMLTHHGRFVTVVDTAQLLMPERPVMGGKDGPGYLLLIGDGSYGLLVDTIGSTRQVNRDGIRWHTGKRRPWLAGTLVEPISALLEVDEILGMFDE